MVTYFTYQATKLLQQTQKEQMAHEINITFNVLFLPSRNYEKKQKKSWNTAALFLT